MAHQEHVRAGDQTFRRAYGPGYDIIRQQIQEIDPNLDLFHPEYAPQGWAALWNGPDGQWHAVTINKSGDPRQLIMLPNNIRERDRNSPANSRESAFERDVRKAEMDKVVREEMAVDKINEAAERVYAGLRKDVGHHYGVTSKRYFDFGTNRTHLES